MFGLRLGLGDADAVVDLVEHPVLNDGADFEVLEEHAGLTAVAVRSVGWGKREWGELNVMERVAPVNLTDRTIRMWPVGLLIAGGLVSQMASGLHRLRRNSSLISEWRVARPERPPATFLERIFGQG